MLSTGCGAAEEWTMTLAVEAGAFCLYPIAFR